MSVNYEINANKKAPPFGDAHKSPSIRFDFDPFF